MELRTAASYARELRPELPASAFAPARSRALWLPVHTIAIATVTWALAAGVLPWFVSPAASRDRGLARGARVLDRDRRADRLGTVRIRVPRAARRGEHDRHGVHRDQPQPEPVDSDQRSARQLADSDAAASVRVAHA